MTAVIQATSAIEPLHDNGLVKDGTQVATSGAGRLSDALAALGNGDEDQLTLSDVLAAMGDRGPAMLLFFAALINLLPSPPGTTLVTGIPLMVAAALIVLGRTDAWLPRVILDKPFPAKSYRSGLERALPSVKRLEAYVRRRAWPRHESAADRCVGIVALVLATIVFLPIPLGNWLPALSLALIGLGLAERDGRLVSVGIAIGCASVAILAAAVGVVATVASAVLA